MTKQMSARKTLSATSLAACPVEQAINIIGGKWKMLILRALLLGGPKRYNQLLKSVTGINPKELTRNLAELKAAALVARADSITIRTPHYALTDLGAGLMPAFKALLIWGKQLNHHK